MWDVTPVTNTRTDSRKVGQYSVWTESAIYSKNWKNCWGSGTPCPACSAPRGCPGCSRTWQNVFLQWRSDIVLYLKLAWATHSLVIDSGTSSWSSRGNCTAGNLPPYMNFSWWANKARFTLKLGFRMAQHSIWSLPVPLGDQPCPVSPIHTHLLKGMFFDGFTIQLGVTGKTAF